MRAYISNASVLWNIIPDVLLMTSRLISPLPTLCNSPHRKENILFNSIAKYIGNISQSPNVYYMASRKV